MKKTRLTALILALIMLVTLFSGCALKPYVVVIDGTKIRQGIFAYYYSYCYAAYYDTYGDDGVSYYTFTSVCQHILVYRLFEELGLEFTEEDEQSVENLRAAWIEKIGGQSEYAKFLRTLGLTDKLYREILTVQPMYYKIRQTLYGEGGEFETTEDDLRELYREQYVHALHIFVSTSGVETTEDYDALRAKADEAYTRAAAGEDFSKLIIEYGDDPTLAKDPYTGYYASSEDLNSETSTVLFGLDVGGVSEVCVSTDGFYIYKRLAFDDKFLDSILSDPTVYETYVNELFYYHLLDLMSSFNIEYYDEFYEVDFSAGASYWQDSASTVNPSISQ